jgi:hypothetical protein
MGFLVLAIAGGAGAMARGLSGLAALDGDRPFIDHRDHGGHVF